METVSEVGIVDGRHNRRGHVLEPLESVERRVRLHGDALESLVEFLQPAGGAINVPLVPRPATKWVTWPSVCFQISLAVVR